MTSAALDATPAPPTEEERRALARIRSRRRAYWISFLMVLPALAVAMRLAQEDGVLWAATVPLALVAVFGVAGRRVNASRCPRCGDHFFFQQGPLGPAGTTFPAQRECQSCGLPLRSPSAGAFRSDPTPGA